MTNITGIKKSQSILDNIKGAGLQLDNLPRHIAIIMDGNGRWALANNKPRTYGHKQGTEALRQIIKTCVSFNIHYLSVYAFSTENWSRPDYEVTFLMSLLKTMIDKEIDNLHENGIRVRIIGNVEKLPSNIKNTIKVIEEKTTDNTTMQLNLMINYGSRSEILHCIDRIVKVQQNESPSTIDESLISDHLLTFDSPDPDILIRTGGEYRLSNFMLYQLSYAELFFSKTYWPDFNKEELLDILLEFQSRQRRYGAL
ncbi:isoprenyl transferase [Candidatus Marinamargulisbacteria bacterium SCGC AG-414-C22]|nr:isoprenyl transferase [Candidatus Marinamargulisbacteria bacterium SCGC AG-414-C22]